jgi:hypothetical protein
MLGKTAKAAESSWPRRVLINRDLIEVALLCPLCPGNDQIPQRREMTRCAKSGSEALISSSGEGGMI